MFAYKISTYQNIIKVSVEGIVWHMPADFINLSLILNH